MDCKIQPPEAVVDTNSLSIMCKKFHLGDPEQGDLGGELLVERAWEQQFGAVLFETRLNSPQGASNL